MQATELKSQSSSTSIPDCAYLTSIFVPDSRWSHNSSTSILPKNVDRTRRVTTRHVSILRHRKRTSNAYTSLDILDQRFGRHWIAFRLKHSSSTTVVLMRSSSPMYNLWR